MEKYIELALKTITGKIPRLTGVKCIPNTTAALADVKQSVGHKILITIMPFDNGNVKAELFDMKSFKTGVVFKYEYYANNYNGNYAEIGQAIAEYIDAMLGPVYEGYHDA